MAHPIPYAQILGEHLAIVGRTWVNNECDRLAKRGMRRARASQRLEELRV